MYVKKTEYALTAVSSYGMYIRFLLFHTPYETNRRDTASTRCATAQCLLKCPLHVKYIGLHQSL